jgi:hypothetical protein
MDDGCMDRLMVVKAVLRDFTAQSKNWFGDQSLEV